MVRAARRARPLRRQSRSPAWRQGDRLRAQALRRPRALRAPAAAGATSPRCATSCAGAKRWKSTASRMSRCCARSPSAISSSSSASSSSSRAGFTVLTGETGAGKSILIDALQLALGGRGDGGVVREGAARAEISRRVRVAPANRSAPWLDDAGLEGDAGHCCCAAPSTRKAGAALLHQRQRRHARAAARSGRPPDRHPRPARAPVADARAAQRELLDRTPGMRSSHGTAGRVSRLEAAGGGRGRARKGLRRSRSRARAHLEENPGAE